MLTIERHVFDKADMERFLLCEGGKIHNLVLVDPLHHDRVDLDLFKTQCKCLVDAAHHVLPT